MQPQVSNLQHKASHLSVEVNRRFLLQNMLLLSTGLASTPLFALMPKAGDIVVENINTLAPHLTVSQTQAFRSWIQVLVAQQINKGANPRWQQRDCAGLVRFVCAEALADHTSAWLKANGLLGVKTPPEIDIPLAARTALRHRWMRADGTTGAFVSALELIQHNTRFVGKEISRAAIADLLLFDQGQAQHLMIWMGQYVAYHTGTTSPTDNGLRAYPLKQLMTWKDTRWQPRADNPNFLGVFRLNFLSTS